jgi:hypothetical protein
MRRRRSERVFVGRDVQVVDLPDDDPVIVGGMLGDGTFLDVLIRRLSPSLLWP